MTENEQNNSIDLPGNNLKFIAIDGTVYLVTFLIS